MQMDEDVGKVAQATPVLICTPQLSRLFFFHHRTLSPLSNSPQLSKAKALELFMQSLIDKACAETRSRNGKRLSVAHL